jgi:hypothetical protein
MSHHFSQNATKLSRPVAVDPLGRAPEGYQQQHAYALTDAWGTGVTTVVLSANLEAECAGLNARGFAADFVRGSNHSSLVYVTALVYLNRLKTVGMFPSAEDIRPVFTLVVFMAAQYARDNMNVKDWYVRQGGFSGLADFQRLKALLCGHIKQFAVLPNTIFVIEQHMMLVTQRFLLREARR